MGALLRREGLYSSLLSAWRRQRDAGELSNWQPEDLEVFSRYVVGWRVAHRESATLAQKRGTSMTAKLVALLMADLGVTETHSKPHVSNDNPFNEAHFKTLKYWPDFPLRFGCLQNARGFCSDFFGEYNQEHHHAGLGLLTPHDVHHGLAAERIAARAAAQLARFIVDFQQPAPADAPVSSVGRGGPLAARDDVVRARLETLPEGAGAPRGELVRVWECALARPCGRNGRSGCTPTCTLRTWSYAATQTFRELPRQGSTVAGRAGARTAESSVAASPWPPSPRWGWSAGQEQAWALWVDPCRFDASAPTTPRR